MVVVQILKIILLHTIVKLNQFCFKSIKIIKIKARSNKLINVPFFFNLSITYTYADMQIIINIL